MVQSSIVVSPVLDNGLHKVCTVDDWGIQFGVQDEASRYKCSAGLLSIRKWLKPISLHAFSKK